MTHRSVRMLGPATVIFACLAAASLPSAAQMPTVPEGYSVRSVVFMTNAWITGFDIADDGSVVMLLGSGYYTRAERLVRLDPLSGSMTTLHTFADAPYGNFVEVVGDTVYFGQSGVFGDSGSATNRIMSVGIDGSGLTTNLILQNYAAAHDPAGRLFFTGSPDSNAVFLVSGGATNRVVEMPEYSAGLTFSTNGDLYAGQFSAFWENNLFRFTAAQISNAVAQGTRLLPENGTQIATNIAGSSTLAADADDDIFFADFVWDLTASPGSLYTFNISSNSASLFGTVTGAVVSALQFVPGRGAFEAGRYSAGTLYAALSDYGITNRIVAIEVPNTLTSWREFHFTDDERVPALENDVWGFFADPDADGLPNGIEYALGRDPRRADAAGAISNPIQEGRLTLSFVRDPLNRDVDYIVEVSGSLAAESWQEIARSSGGGPAESSGIGAASISEALEGGRIRVTVGDPMAASATRRFIRLRAEVINP